MKGLLMNMLRRGLEFCRATHGAASVEYGLLIAGIALAIFASVMLLGQTVFNRFYSGAERLIH